MIRLTKVAGFISLVNIGMIMEFHVCILNRFLVTEQTKMFAF